MADPRPPSRPGRLLYCGALLYLALDGFRHNDYRVDLARRKGVPLPGFLVPFATGMLVVATVAITVWRRPRAAAGAVALFFLATTPTIHDFWNADDTDYQSEKQSFAKNAALFGGALLLLERADRQRD
ncbi:MAG: DoxX family protein [Halarchaeum sp.]